MARRSARPQASGSAPRGVQRPATRSAQRRSRDDDYDDDGYDDYDDRPARSRRSGGMKPETKILIGVGGAIGLIGIVLIAVYFSKTGAVEQERREREALRAWNEKQVEMGKTIAAGLGLSGFADIMLAAEHDAEPDGVFFINAVESIEGPDAFRPALTKAENWVKENVTEGLKSKPGVIAVYIERDVKYQK